MINLNKKQKVILTIIIITCISFFYIYYEKTKEKEEETNLTIEETATKNQTKENEKEEKTLIFIHVSGAVNKPGVIELEENSRIGDAIEKAGGINKDANIEDINLAYKLEDGMKIHIPTNQEVEENKKQNVKEDENNEYITNSSKTATNENTNNKEAKQSKININKATQEELDTLPGIGPSTAIKIIEYRKEKGNFKTIEEIKEVSGIGEAKYSKIKDLIIVK